MGPSPQKNGPTRFGRYTLLEPIGEGGMAKVFVARKDGATDISVLKQLHVQLEQNSEAAKRFIREANIASQLVHPNIAGIVDAGVEDGRFCLAMEFIAGQTVEAMVKRAKAKGGILPLEISIPIVLQTLEALAYAHDLTDPATGAPLGIVHRDMSPRNVMIDYAGQVKVIDFGIAKGDVDEYKTAAGVLMGTPYYMSPEQARALKVDRRSDIYTLAAVFFEMLTGKRLVRASGRAKILMTVARQIAPPVSSVNPKVPSALDPVLAKALAKKPEERYGNAQAFAAALRLAAGEAAFTTPQVIGAFLRDLFPDGESKSMALIQRSRAAFPDAPPVEATRLAGMDGAVLPTDLSAPGGVGAMTKTGYMDPSMAAADAPGVAAPPPGGVPMTFSSEFPSGAMDPAATNFSRTTIPPAPSQSPKVLIVLAVAVLVAAGGLVWRFLSQPSTDLSAVTQPTTEQKTPVVTAQNPPPVRTVAAVPPPPKEIPTAKATKKRTVRPTKRVNTKRSPPPPAKTAPPKAPPVKKASPHDDLRRRLREVKRSRNKAAALRLALDVRKRGDKLGIRNVSYYADSAVRTGDIDAILENLTDAVKALP